MLNFGDYSSVLRKRPGGQIVDALDWAISGGPAKWCDDITYSADETITQLFITANVFTVNITKTLTLTQRRPLVVIADSIIVNGTIEASGKGCDGAAAGAGAASNRYSGIEWPFEILTEQEAYQARNYCLCGAGGGGSSANTYDGGGAYGVGGNGGDAATNTAGADCDLTDAQLKELLFSPFFNIFQVGLGGGGGSSSAQVGGIGGGSILLIAKIITVGSAGSVLANGLGGTDDAANPSAGGGGGFAGLIGDTLSVHGSATITANKGAGATDTGDASNDTEAGGDGACVQIEV